jgi:hypothetical protein
MAVILKDEDGSGPGGVNIPPYRRGQRRAALKLIVTTDHGLQSKFYFANRRINYPPPLTVGRDS